MPEKQSFAKSLIQSLGESRDAKIGAVGAQQIRDAYSEGNNMWADLYAKQLTGANALGISGALLGNAWASSPFVRVGLDTAGSIDGMRNFFSGNGIQKTIRKYKEGDYWGAIKSGLGDALDITGVRDIARISSRILKPAYRALHAYDSIYPFGYDHLGRQVKNYANNLIMNPKVDIANPRWRLENFHDLPEKYLNRRQDAWAIYNGLPQTHGTYVKVDGTLDTYRYNDAVNADIKQALFSRSVRRDLDMGGNHRGLGGDEFIFKKDPKSGQITADWHTSDTWDLNPFEKRGFENGTITFSGRLKHRLQDKMGSEVWRNRAQNLREKLFFKKDGSYKFNHYFKLDSILNKYRSGDYDWQWRVDPKAKTNDLLMASPYGPADILIDKIVQSKPLQKIDNKLSTLEVSKYVGGKPFNLDNTIHLNADETFGLNQNVKLKPEELKEWQTSFEQK